MGMQDMVDTFPLAASSVELLENLERLVLLACQIHKVVLELFYLP
jgi:hypothetical protein